MSPIHGGELRARPANSEDADSIFSIFSKALIITPGLILSVIRLLQRKAYLRGTDKDTSIRRTHMKTG
jgi:hypothetical protein